MEKNKKYDAIELARVLKDPVDPRKPYPKLIDKLCEVDTASPNEYLYYYDVLLETDRVYTTIANGVTQVAVTVDTPTAFTFLDRATPEYYLKITDLAGAKEKALARKKKTIARSLDAYEIYYLLDTIDTAATAQGNTEGLLSGSDHFNYKNLVNMIDQVVDYGDNYTLVVGSTIDKDIKLWDWEDNKYTSLKDALDALNVDIIRVKGSVTLDGSAVDLLSSTVAYLIAEETTIGKPCLFVRKELSEIEGIANVITEKDAKVPQRLTFVSPNPVSVGTNNTRYLAIGLTGYEQVVTAVINAYGLSKFTRA